MEPNNSNTTEVTRVRAAKTADECAKHIERAAATLANTADIRAQWTTAHETMKASGRMTDDSIERFFTSLSGQVVVLERDASRDLDATLNAIVKALDVVKTETNLGIKLSMTRNLFSVVEMLIPKTA